MDFSLGILILHPESLGSKTLLKNLENTQCLNSLIASGPNSLLYLAVVHLSSYWFSCSFNNFIIRLFLVFLQGRGSGFPGRRRSRGGGVGGGRGARGRSRLKAQDSLTVLPGVWTKHTCTDVPSCGCIYACLRCNNIYIYIWVWSSGDWLRPTLDILVKDLLKELDTRSMTSSGVLLSTL